MVTLTLEKLDGNKNTVYTWTFTNFNMWGLTLGFPIVDVPLPQEDQKERILMKLMGNTSDTKFSWTVKDETSSQVTEQAGIDRNDLLNQLMFNWIIKRVDQDLKQPVREIFGY